MAEPRDATAFRIHSDNVLSTPYRPSERADRRPDSAGPAALIRARALALGFDAIGFAPAALGPEAGARLRAFLASGQHGEMDWLAERAGQRAEPTALWPEARTVVCVGLSYAPEGDALATLAQPTGETSRSMLATATITMSRRVCSSIWGSSWPAGSASR